MEVPLSNTQTHTHTYTYKYTHIERKRYEEFLRNTLTHNACCWETLQLKRWNITSTAPVQPLALQPKPQPPNPPTPNPDTAPWSYTDSSPLLPHVESMAGRWLIKRADADGWYCRQELSIVPEPPIPALRFSGSATGSTDTAIVNCLSWAPEPDAWGLIDKRYASWKASLGLSSLIDTSY